MSEQDNRRMARLRWIVSEAAEAIDMPVGVGAINALADAMSKVCEEQGIWLMFKDRFEEELAELVKDVGE